MFAISVIVLIVGLVAFIAWLNPTEKNFLEQHRYLAFYAAVSVIIIGILGAFYYGSISDTKSQNNTAAQMRSKLADAATTQDKYLKLNGNYAQTNLSLATVNRRYFTDNSIEIGAGDGSSYIMRLHRELGPVEMTFTLIKRPGRLVGTCSAPAHTGCLNGHWNPNSP